MCATLYFLAFLLSVFLFPFFHLSVEQQPELNKKIMENLCDSATDGGEGTYDVLYLPTLPKVFIRQSVSALLERARRAVRKMNLRLAMLILVAVWVFLHLVAWQQQGV